MKYTIFSHHDQLNIEFNEDTFKHEVMQNPQGKKFKRLFGLLKIAFRLEPTKTYAKECPLCGKDMNLPGEYRTLEGRRISCWECWENLPLCGECGKGTKHQRCTECR